MIASRLSLYLVLFFTLAVAIATPITRPGGKRTNVSDVEAILKTLKTSTDSILSKINELISTGAATDATVTPLANDLTSAFDSAASALDTLEPVDTPEDSDEIVTLTSNITNDIATTLNNAQAIIISKAFAGAGVAVSRVFTVLETVLPGLSLPLGIIKGAALGLLQGLQPAAASFLQSLQPAAVSVLQALAPTALLYLRSLQGP